MKSNLVEPPIKELDVTQNNELIDYVEIHHKIEKLNDTQDII